VFKTLNAAEAQLICSRLEAAGLDPEMDPEFDPLSVAAGAGIEVKVPQAQADDARALLASAETSPE